METDTADDAALWSKLAAQGYTGIIFDEAYGGVGLGVVELVLLMEEAGRALLPGPFFSTVALAGAVLDACAQRRAEADVSGADLSRRGAGDAGDARIERELGSGGCRDERQPADA